LIAKSCVDDAEEAVNQFLTQMNERAFAGIGVQMELKKTNCSCFLVILKRNEKLLNNIFF